MDNLGVLTIEEGIIDELGIQKNLKELIDADWPWQLKKTDEAKYIIRFPPNRKIEQLVIGKASLFHLNKGTVVASLSVWDGDVEPIGRLVEVWVQIKGIPPKWVDWDTLREVASSIGLMVEVDWHSLFNSFFGSARVKLQCKDPSRIPKERIFVFSKKLYLISFKTEGFEQKDNSSDDGSEKGDDDLDLDEDDLLDENPKDKNTEKDARPEGNDSGSNGVGGSGQTADEGQGKLGSTSGGKSVKRVLNFEEVIEVEQNNALECINLLRAMELDEDEVAMESVDMDISLEMQPGSEVQDDSENLNLPKEWIYDLSSQVKASKTDSQSSPMLRHGLGQNPELFDHSSDKKEAESSYQSSVLLQNLQSPDETEVGDDFPLLSSQPTFEDLERVKQDDQVKKGRKDKKKQQWGPVIPLRRSSRIVDNGGTMMAKAQEAKRKWNLNDNTGKKSYSNVVSANLLLSVAKDIGIDVMDGNPDLLQNMIDLDDSRSKNYKVECKYKDCCRPAEPGLVVEDSVIASVNNGRSPPNAVRTDSNDLDDIDQELGWSKVGPKKKARKKTR